MRYLILAETKASAAAPPGQPTAPPPPPPPTPSGRDPMTFSPQGPAEHEWAGDLYQEGDETDPADAFAVFRGAEGEEAWLDQASDGTLTGWVRDVDGSVYRYTDPEAWAVDVDDAGMERADAADVEPEEPAEDEDAEDDAEPTGEGMSEGIDDELTLTSVRGKALIAVRELPGGVVRPKAARAALDTARRETKHLPGQHNQQTHGRRYSHNPARLLLRGVRTRPTRRLLRAVNPPTSSTRRRGRNTPTTPGSRGADRARRRPIPRQRPQPEPRKRTVRDLPSGEITARDLDGLDWSTVSDDDAVSIYQRIRDPDALEILAAEMDRRDAVERRERPRPPAKQDMAGYTPEEFTAGENRIDDMWGSSGGEPASPPPPRKTIERQIREQYDLFVHNQWLQAEAWTRGHMLNKEGQRRGIDPVRLFSGPSATARKYASEDLLRFWTKVSPRMTWQEFRTHALGRPSDRRIERRRAGRNNAQDWRV